METHIKVIGVIQVFLALAHVFFPGYFRWKDDLKPLSLINRQMMEVHTFFIALTVLLMGLLCLCSAADLVAGPFGKTVTLGLAVFWSARLYVQFFVYSAALWRGKRFETIVHVLFSATWMYFSGVFWWNYFA